MTRLVGALAVVCGAAGLAAAQPPLPGGGTPQRPPFSPYLNLFRRGGSTAFNYYGLVRPEQRAIASANQFQQQFGQVNQQLNMLTAQVATPDQFGSSVPFGYFTHRSYFMNNAGGGGGGGAVGGGGATGPRGGGGSSGTRTGRR